jgi:hypothetical protein
MQSMAVASPRMDASAGGAGARRLVRIDAVFSRRLRVADCDVHSAPWRSEEENTALTTVRAA